MVEFTLVFILLILPLTLFGMQLVLSTFIRQQATAAARDGARAAVVGYDNADVANSANNNRVKGAVLARLAFTPSDIQVRCTGPDAGGSSALASKSCALATPDSDRVEVTVEMKPIKVVGSFGIFGPLLPDPIISKASQVVVTRG